MHIKYGMLINVEGALTKLDADLSGNVKLSVLVKGSTATITLPIKEAKRLSDEMKKLDVDGLAALYGD